ncbi:MAG: hypothetical protein ACM33T_00495 [Solirubrobacterales bacterium]
MATVTKVDTDVASDIRLADSHCMRTEDFFSVAARDLVGRYLTNFLDGLVITPTELVHSAKYQKRLHDAGRTLINAVDKIGTIQARAKGENAVQRVKELDALVSAASRKVWDDEKERPVPNVTPETFLEVAGKVKPGPERDYTVNRILVDHLFQYKVWKEKVSVLVRIARLAQGTEDARLVEVPLAECLKSDAALDQLLGMPERLETRCNDLVDLWNGTWTPRDTAADVVADINAMVAEGNFPMLKAALEYSLLRALNGKMPLRSAEPEPEIQAVFDLFRRMWVGNSLIGGPKALAMLEKRQVRNINTEMVTDLLRERKVLADRVAFLMTLSTLAIGQSCRTTLKTFIDHYFGDQDFIPRVIGGQDAPVPKLQTLTQIHRAIRASWLSDDEKGTYAARVEAAQAELMKRSRLFEQVDRKGGGPAQKVLTLLDMCRKNTFIEGSNLETVKKAVAGYLRDPSFGTDYLGTAQGEERERKVSLLSKTLATIGIRWG